uniref:Fibronectin type-III domain-containing protein n=1 Tax=Macrostomum lignano TaxID=282301 RepID=A0A1I8G1D6_9PLAT
VVYQGSSHSTRLTRLAELTDYYFRIRATNEARLRPLLQSILLLNWQGASACDEAATTIRADPGQLAGSTGPACDLWVYRGSDQSCKLTCLNPNTEYQVRVAAARRCSETGDELIGAFSQGVVFITRAGVRLGLVDKPDCGVFWFVVLVLVVCVALFHRRPRRCRLVGAAPGCRAARGIRRHGS